MRHDDQPVVYSQHLRWWMSLPERDKAHRMLDKFSVKYVKQFILKMRHHIARVQPHERKTF